jgi:hypothetical protein
VSGALAGSLGGSGAVAPWGILGGLVAGWAAETVSDGMFDGALAGLLGGVATVLLLGTFSAARTVLTTTDVGTDGFVDAYTSVVGLMIIPTFAVEGIVIGPLSRYAKVSLG